MSIATITNQPRPEGAAAAYWDARAQRYARRGAGLAAVCSYGMPFFYNRYIDLVQRLALSRWLRVAHDARVLEIGCGVGRWTRRLAAQTPQVTAIDLAQTMLVEARRRTVAAGVDKRCRFVSSDVTDLAVRGQFDLIVGVTVLQHVMDESRFDTAIAEIAARLAPGGRAVLLEAAPSRTTARCDSAVFRARAEADFRRAFSQAGLSVVAVTGVDPAPFKTWFLPWYRRLPRPLGLAALLVVTLASLPIDIALGRTLRQRSWHKVFILRGVA